ncbi:MAG: tRNA (adenosine(37)-N6)-threonylcarbamoyltransferase complex dimerization subunit type 1 TsaB [Planctomycetota bacterium]
MTKIIALETSGPVGSVALGGEVETRSRVFERGQRHARDLMPALEELMKEVGWSPEELDAVIVDVGPGSYTGVRVAVAAARTLAFAVNATLIGVDSLSVLAQALGGDRPLCVVLDARRGHAYWDVFVPDEHGTMSPQHGPGLAKPEQIVSQLPERCRLIGSGLAVYGDVLRERGFELIESEETATPDAAVLLALGESAYENGARPALHDAQPIYLRPSEAEILWEQRHGKS